MTITPSDAMTEAATPPTARYALYFAPDPGHPLWLAGCEWLGRDPRPDGFALSPRPEVSEPHRYGFHGTLKAPMALRAGVEEADLLARLKQIAARFAPFAMPPLSVQALQGFIALCPVAPLKPSHPLRRLADACVRDADDLRRLPSPQETARRLAGGTYNETQLAYLRRWGYPHVLDQWRFHMTLTNSFDDSNGGRRTRQRLMDEAHACMAHALSAPLTCSSISVFVEASPSEPFVLRHRVALKGSAGRL